MMATRSVSRAEQGQALAGMLFTEPVKIAYAQVRSDVEARKLRLRVRLRIRTQANALHGIRWETLADPLEGADYGQNG